MCVFKDQRVPLASLHYRVAIVNTLLMVFYSVAGTIVAVICLVDLLIGPHRARRDPCGQIGFVLPTPDYNLSVQLPRDFYYTMTACFLC